MYTVEVKPLPLVVLNIPVHHHSCPRMNNYTPGVQILILPATGSFFMHALRIAVKSGYSICVF